ncbi:hypothetical protein BK658_01475 [Pseudomonas brassicacearum]|uniref:Uncharacterized protein n=1 Tax=Pseudomonas brassicacearum TaxID=930166 RepID=A0A423H183_9PSED|nr:hypothetical protein BK658_01475 [Pseudomonas brassicacearum]
MLRFMGGSALTFKEIQALWAIRNTNAANDIALLEHDARLAFISGTKTTTRRRKLRRPGQ